MNTAYNVHTAMNRCPYDTVMSFIYRYKPQKENKAIKILEIGCGAGNNVWFLAHEGFDVYGIDINNDAIAYANARLNDDNLDGALIVGDFIQLPFADNTFDLVFDRAALTLSSFDDATNTIKEVHRVLKTNGKFLFTPYSELNDNFFKGDLLTDGRIANFNEICNFGPNAAVSFYSLKDIYQVFGNGWSILEITHIKKMEFIKKRSYDISTWEVVGEKSSN